MSYVIADPQALATVATEIEGIGSAFSAATAAAAAPTSGVAAAAGDEVSAAIANVFGAVGKEYQAVVAQFAAFHNQFQQTLASAGLAYAEAEAGIAATLGLGGPAPAAPLPAATIPPFPANQVSYFIGGTGVPIPSTSFVTRANALYVRSANALQALFTPEQLYPLTGVKSLPLNQSVAEGVTILDNTLYNTIHNQGQSVTVFGISQSAIISSLEMQNLANGTSLFGANPPPVNMLNFVLTGNEVNPNGGLLSRFPNLSLPALGLDFYPAMNANTPYHVANYTLEYDGFADFPRYPINLLADLNAVAGIVFVHTTYLDLTPLQVDNAIQLPTSPGYTGNTTYYMIPTAELPLLKPLGAIPVIGKPLVDLLQPDLKVLVNLGYGPDPTLGYSTSYADVPTPFGLFPDANPGTVFNALAAGTQQGIHDFSLDMQQIAAQPPAVVPQLTLPSAPGPTTTPPNFPSPQQVFDTVNRIVSTDYAVVLPTADIGYSLATELPFYDSELFLSQLGQGNLINAIGYPIAADVGLGTVAGGVEALTIVSALASNVKDIQSLVP
ncbi:PE-PPE domain-containing protein [Mycobacterium paraense]|uniref:PE family protein n=1 Tax=Mycobacterium paraense TaxID=767916 RepID=UPI000A15DC56|nr:PE-PPE domain-containing protein [Mycobacterium paraense]MCV7445477.1 PE-PPE domain-containing protein [Mycobacterium paraense]ORW46769.1 PE family protein [Mycobacterium paraense]